MKGTRAIHRITTHRPLLVAAFLLCPWLAAEQMGPACAQDILTDRSANRQERLIDGAKKEGQVVLYSAMIVNQTLRPLTDAFMKKYPFVKMTYWRGDSDDIFARLSAEVRAGNVVGDVIEGTSVGENAVQAGLLQPYYTPMVEAFPERYRDPRGLWAATRLSYFSIAYNTKMVPADQVPKSYDDLLDPRWRGKMAWRIGSSSGTPLFITNLRLARGEEQASEYFAKLATQKIINFGSGSARTLVDRVVAGEFPIALNIFAHHPLISKAKGAPVNSQLLDPVPTTAATIGVPKGVRHPHAALLLIDFILSKEGQEILARAEYFPARPDVLPLPEVGPVVPAAAGVRDNFVSPEALIRQTEGSEAIYQKLFR
jgi:ABC-type Fe3+ transport system substrate-binding protein